MPKSPEKTRNIIEAALMAAGQPLSIDRLLTLFLDDQQPTRDEIKHAIDVLIEQCKDRGVELKEVSSGYRYQAKQDYAQWVARLWEEKPPRYSRALLETLSLIAYRQPITRGEIEDVRGVSVSTNIIRTLLERDWVKVVGHRDVPGKPSMYATTRQFLDYFNLKSLSDLPTLAEIRDIDTINAELNFMEPGSEVDANAAENNEIDTGSVQDIDVAEDTSADDMSAVDEKHYGAISDPGSDPDPDSEAEMENMPPMDDVSELKTMPAADTA